MKIFTTRQVESVFGLKRQALAVRGRRAWNNTLNMTVREWMNVPKRTAFKVYGEFYDVNRFGSEIKGSRRAMTGEEEIKLFMNLRDTEELLKNPPANEHSKYSAEAKFYAMMGSMTLAVFSFGASMANLGSASVSKQAPVLFGVSALSGGLAVYFFKSFSNDACRAFENFNFTRTEAFKREMVDYYVDHDIPKGFFDADPEMAELLDLEVSRARSFLRPCHRHHDCMSPLS